MKKREYSLFHYLLMYFMVASSLMLLASILFFIFGLLGSSRDFALIVTFSFISPLSYVISRALFEEEKNDATPV